MTWRSETPPPPANIDFGVAPANDRPNAAQLKADIDSGRTGDKVPHGDVGAAMLGTCEEAGGASPTPEQVKLARETEAAPRSVRRMADPQGQRNWVMPAFVGFIATTALVIGGAFWIGL